MLTLTFNGLSKAYRVAGYRSGWLVITGPKEHAESFLEGISLLANMRLCPNVPAQHAIQVALGGHQSIEDLVLPGGAPEAEKTSSGGGTPWWPFALGAGILTALVAIFLYRRAAS